MTDPDVDTLVDRALLVEVDHLGRAVLQRCVLLDFLLGVDDGGRIRDLHDLVRGAAKVAQLELAVRADEDVFDLARASTVRSWFRKRGGVGVGRRVGVGREQGRRWPLTLRSRCAIGGWW